MPTSRLDMPGMLPRKDSNAARTFSACSRRSSGEVPRTRHMTTCLIMGEILTPTSQAKSAGVTRTPRHADLTGAQDLYSRALLGPKLLALRDQIGSADVDRRGI